MNVGGASGSGGRGKPSAPSSSSLPYKKETIQARLRISVQL